MKKTPRLIAAALALLLVLGGCGSGEPELIKEPVLPKNDGAPATLRIDAGTYSVPEFTRALEEIIAKYRADFPNTKIEFSQNDPDIRLVSSKDALSADWLMDLTPYADAWKEEGTVSNPAQRIMNFKGGESIYAIPFQYDQIILYYRWDWFHEYNLNYQHDVSQKVSVDIWGKFLEVEEKLGEKGKLVISPEVEPFLFDVMLWSWTDTRNIADMSTGYFLRDGSTIFTLESSANAVNALKRVLDMQTPSEDPMQDFIDGKACMYIGSGMDMRELRDQVPGEVGTDWWAVGMPYGNSGRTVPLLSWTAWGIDKDTPEPEKAAHFLWYLTNADNNTHMYTQFADAGVKPIYREASAYEPSLLEGCWYGEMELLNAAKYLYAIPTNIPDAGDKDPLLPSLLEKLKQGEITPQDMLGELDREYTELLNKFKEENGRLPWEQGNTEG